MKNCINNDVVCHVKKLMEQYKRLSKEELKEELQYLKELKNTTIYREHLIFEIEKIMQ